MDWRCERMNWRIVHVRGQKTLILADRKFRSNLATVLEAHT
jgi:hypothetical protein